MTQPDPLAGPTRSVPAHVPPLLSKLRAETRVAHDRIEVLPGLACLMSTDLQVPAYVRALRGLHAFRARMHASLPALLGGLPGIIDGATYVDDTGVSALAEDLAWFDARPKPPMRLPHSIFDGASALGALYVVEGSALGARVIGRAVQQSLGVAAGSGGSFFCGAAADAARQRWQAFCALLVGMEPRLDGAAKKRVVAGAMGCFAALEASMAEAPAAAQAAPPPARAKESSRMAEAVPSLN